MKCQIVCFMTGGTGAMLSCSYMHTRKWIQFKSSHTGLKSMYKHTQAHFQEPLQDPYRHILYTYNSPCLCYLLQRLPPHTVSPQHSPYCCSHRWHTVSKLLVQRWSHRQPERGGSKIINVYTIMSVNSQFEGFFFFCSLPF